MPNGKNLENPLNGMMSGAHPFPPDIEEMLRKIDAEGRKACSFPLGENWPFSPDEFAWEKGENLDEAREVLQHVISMLEADRGDEVFVDPKTQKPFRIQHR